MSPTCYAALLLALTVSPVFANDGDQAKSNAISQEQCHDKAIFRRLFSLSASKEYQAAQLEYLAAMNANALIQCPKTFLTVLKSSDVVTQQAVLNNLGAQHPPQDIARAIKPLTHTPQLADFIHRHFAAYLAE
ncbi:hypothetical protein [Gallaecimonas mangrovi]|uniref:hypothetical protein n=1 Tax=Gallaecimonas mangrovi TaxID=2291597 RepID=UPI000E20B15E|nr:hypothetical protein [Gallaecimonas mangrovi]